ncbi:hypothetical protein FQR65_LT17770 [Abscondita terminalis]|nr:hypothetical protein FQR65_LT17770 [Abscondita terminalis]
MYLLLPEFLYESSVYWIHLGRNVYLDEVIYDSICFKSKNNSVFVKNLASALFGDYTLQNSSVTGVMCNRLKTDPRPPLNPTITMTIKDILQFKLTRENWTAEEIEAECKHINHILAQKIADVRRTIRTKKNIKDLDMNEPTVEIGTEVIEVPLEIPEIDEATFLSTENQLSENLLQEVHETDADPHYLPSSSGDISGDEGYHKTDESANILEYPSQPSSSSNMQPETTNCSFPSRNYYEIGSFTQEESAGRNEMTEISHPS